MASSGTTSTKTRFTGAQLIVHLLERQGITTVAGIPGGTVLPLYDALSQSTQIRHVLARHEQGAGFIAQGMARTQGKPAVCMACSGPGATNLVTAIADARLDSIPLICITGQVPSSMIGTDAFQEVDTYGISIPITKHNYLVRDISELPQVISDAFRIAQSGRPGPVWIDIPKDVQTAEIEIDVLPEPGERAPAPEFSAESVRDAAAMINAAKRPVLYLGGGTINAADEIRQFAEKANLPTTMTLMALGMLPKAHPLSLGMLGMHGARSTNYILQEADLLIVMGARFDDRAIGKTEQFCPNAKIIHVDIDRAELGKIKQPHVAIQGDVAEVLAQLIPQTEATDRADWRQLVADLQREFPGAIPTEGDPLSHYGLINAVAACVDDSAIITTDVGQHQMWTARRIR
ncbi:acetolactate synthase isozyme 1 large subunit [Enterobacter hormaechei]|nr:acetolactate synthase isozyme 1 large subunit [Enterobacter hormaechei]